MDTKIPTVSKFGWCMTDQHELCTKEFDKTKCECTECGARHGVDAANYKEKQRKVEE